MSYEINVLVNGSRCKQYSHNGKLFIEAKKSSEYSIEIKNNTWQRILAVCSVDGLDILSGKPANENGNGYVVNGNSSLKADGFRVSNEKVAKFLFDYKGHSYATSKNDGSDRNVGVIGVRIFTEKVKPLPPPITVKEEHHHHHHYPPFEPYKPTYPNSPTWPWKEPYYGDSPTIWGTSTTYGCNINNSTLGCDNGPVMDSCYNNEPLGFMCAAAPTKGGSVLRAMNMSATAPLKSAEFDMGTKWGAAKESRVIEVDFEKGILALTTNIYYASRQSLVEMGVPLGTEKQVSFPEPFADGKYAKPPQGWNG